MEDQSAAFGRDVIDAVDSQALSRSERRDQTVQRILDAARHCFAACGFQGASMQHICGEAGMSPGALYRYIPSKEAIIQAITESDRRADADIFLAMFDNPSVVDGVVEAAMGHIRHIHNRNMAPLFAEIRAQSMRNSDIRATCLEHRGDIADRFQAYIQAGIDRGEIAPVAEMEPLMAMFMAIGEGFAINDLIGLDLREEAIESMVRGIVVGLLRPTAPRKN